MIKYEKEPRERLHSTRLRTHQINASVNTLTLNWSAVWPPMLLNAQFIYHYVHKLTHIGRKSFNNLIFLCYFISARNMSWHWLWEKCLSRPFLLLRWCDIPGIFENINVNARKGRVWVKHDLVTTMGWLYSKVRRSLVFQHFAQNAFTRY